MGLAAGVWLLEKQEMPIDWHQRNSFILGRSSVPSSAVALDELLEQRSSWSQVSIVGKTRPCQQGPGKYMYIVGVDYSENSQILFTETTHSRR